MNQPIKWHGGKKYLAAKIVDLMPPRDGEKPWHLYREPFAGGLIGQNSTTWPPIMPAGDASISTWTTRPAAARQSNAGLNPSG